jgi:hypothetical protein
MTVHVTLSVIITVHISIKALHGKVLMQYPKLDVYVIEVTIWHQMG